MKKLTITIFALTLLGCQKKEKIQEENITNEQLIKIYSQVGQLHNEALEVAYAGLKNGTIANNGGYKASIADYLDVSVGNLNNAATLSVNIQVFLMKLEALYKAGSNDQYDNLQREYLSRPDLTLTDRKSIIGCVSVLKASTLYWTANISKWKALSKSAVLSEGAKDIPFADVKGAAKGAVTGAIAGASGGTIVLPIVGTVTGAAGVGLAGMVFGAVSASIDAAITGLLKRWIGWTEAVACGTITGQNVRICTREDSIAWIRAHIDSLKTGL